MSKTLIKIGALSVDTADYETPVERTFREAWTFGGDPEAGIISVNMDKAKDLWRNKIRAAREAEFAALDAAFMKAMETGADTTEIVAKKQTLRDAPAHPDIDAATTPDELKAVQPIPNVTVE
jgi:hypothetical protein